MVMTGGSYPLAGGFWSGAARALSPTPSSGQLRKALEATIADLVDSTYRSTDPKEKARLLGAGRVLPAGRHLRPGGP